jgi:predicted lysophospholipase L1 biosynthesis ABC-type transport system permease subunit
MMLPDLTTIARRSCGLGLIALAVAIVAAVGVGTAMAAFAAWYFP